MNNKAHIDLDIIKLLYFKYRAFTLPLVVIFISLYVFFQFVIPQIQNFLSVKDEVAASEQTLAVLTQNYNALASLNVNDLQSSLDTATQAVPQVKDFAGILNAISTAAGLSGVTVNDYSFQIGDINNITDPSTANQTIQISLTIQGDLEQTKKFVDALSKQFPLSEVTSLSVGGANSTVISASFYYATPPKLIFNDTSPLPILSVSQKKILSDLEKNAFGVGVSDIASTGARLVLPTPQVSSVPASSSSH